MAGTYDLTKVDQALITTDEDIFNEDVDVRYSLTIPFLNRREGFSVVIVLMNPSKANMNISDSTVNKLIDFFYDYQVNGHPTKDITICNVLPIYSSNAQSTISKIRKLHLTNVLDKVQKINEARVKLEIKDM